MCEGCSQNQNLESIYHAPLCLTLFAAFSLLSPKVLHHRSVLCLNLVFVFQRSIYVLSRGGKQPRKSCFQPMLLYFLLEKNFFHKATTIKCLDLHDMCAQLKLEGWLYIVLIFYTLFNEEALFYKHFLVRRHHFIGNVREEAPIHGLFERGAILLGKF